MNKEELCAIIEADLSQDKTTIISRWDETLRYYWPEAVNSAETEENEFIAIEQLTPSDSAKTLLLFTACLIKYAEFEVSVMGSVDEACHFNKPSPELCVADYLSHGGHIIIDSIKLSSEQQRALREIYGKASNGCMEEFTPVVLSSALRKSDAEANLTEEISFSHAAIEHLKSAVNAAGRIWDVAKTARKWGVAGPDRTDFGLELSVGGSKHGTPAQFVAHHSIDSEGNLNGILLGLEEVILPEAKRVGEYTAANSLPFKNLLYRVKHFQAHQALLPKARNGMRIVLSEASYQNVYQKFQEICALPLANMYQAFQELLESPPDHARKIGDADGYSLHDKHLILFDGETPNSVSACIRQVASVASEPIDASLEGQCTALLTAIQPWISYFLDTGSLPQSAKPIPALPTCTQVNLSQLSQVLSQTVKIIRKKANEEIKTLRREAKELENIHSVFNQYLSLQDTGMLNTNAEVFKKLQRYITEKKEFDTTLDGYLGKLDRGELSSQSGPLFTPACPLPHLIRLHRLKQEASELLSSNESRIILRLLQVPALIPEDPIEQSDALGYTLQN